MHSPSVGHTPVQSAGTPMLSSGGSIGASSDSLIEYTRYLQRQNWRLQSQQLIENLRKLPPIQVLTWLLLMICLFHEIIIYEFRFLIGSFQRNLMMLLNRWRKN